MRNLCNYLFLNNYFRVRSREQTALILLKPPPMITATVLAKPQGANFA
jgi:hypothetical protein